MNNQQIFDRVTSHLRKQKVAAHTEYGGCRYRGPEGTSCAAGCLISDEVYFSGLEQQTADSSDVREALQESLGGDFDMNFVMALQLAHDGCMPRCALITDSGSDISMDEWEKEMQGIAEEYKLVYTPPSD